MQLNFVMITVFSIVSSSFPCWVHYKMFCSVMVHLFPFMFISHLWTEEKSEGVALHAPFISKSECLPTSQSLAIALCGNFPNLFRNRFIIKIDYFIIITYLKVQRFITAITQISFHLLKSSHWLGRETTLPFWCYSSSKIHKSG